MGPNAVGTLLIVVGIVALVAALSLPLIAAVRSRVEAVAARDHVAPGG